MKDDVEFSEKEKITIIQHTAQGLQYLHDSNISSQMTSNTTNEYEYISDIMRLFTFSNSPRRFSGDEYRGVPMFLTYSPPSDDDVSVSITH
jgi:hypothetical protein